MPNLNESSTVVPSAARTATGNSAVLTGYGSADSIRAQLNVTAASCGESLMRRTA